MTESRRQRLVIFDCDGVLVDSEPTSNRVLAGAIQDAGLAIDVEEVTREFEGMRLADIQVEVEARLGKSLSPGWLPEFERRRETAFREGLEAVIGVEEVLRTLRAGGYLLCVASQAKREKTELTLGLTGLRGHFEDDALFSSTMVERGKPFPDLFFLAAEEMGAEPASTVVVEDGLLGVRAARAAGMRVLGYAPRGDGERLAAENAEVFSSMQELPGLLG